jgi:hypothetical protein
MMRTSKTRNNMMRTSKTPNNNHLEDFRDFKQHQTTNEHDMLMHSSAEVSAIPSLPRTAITYNT